MQSSEAIAGLAGEDISLEKINRCGVVTLKRVKSLNALTPDMFRALGAFYVDCMNDHHIYGIVLRSDADGAFCAGGDVRLTHELKNNAVDQAREFFALEYQFNWTLERFNKPHIALLNGLVMGGGVGISLYGTHRVAGENFSFAMPEARIGFVPDIGSAFKLSRLPAHLGVYLGLTGQSINAADAYALGLVTHCISSDHYEEIEAAMVESDPIDPILEGLHQDPGASKLADIRPWIIEAFSAGTVEEIISRLRNLGPQGAAWGKQTIELLEERSPLSLKISLRHIREAKKDISLKDTLARDYRLACRFLEGADFAEGVRAFLIDKDKKPAWSHASVGDVTVAEVDAYFAQSDDTDMVFVDHGDVG